MGGQAAARGYLLQALICVLDSLDNEHDWQSLTIEPNDESEKVDVTWRYEDYRKVVQVKSSQDTITRSKIIHWAQELKESVVAEKYELRLIGPVAGYVASRESKIEDVTIPIPAALNVSALVSQAAHRLDHYLSKKTLPKRLLPTSRELVIYALTGKLSEFSTEGEELPYDKFNALLDSWLKEFPSDIPAIGITDTLRNTYSKWVHHTSSTFYVPGLNITMPIEDAWIRLRVMQDDNVIVGTKSSLDEQFQNYLEFGQRLSSANHSSTVTSDSLPLAQPRFILVGGPGNGKSTMLKRFAWRLSKENAIVISVRLPVVLQYMNAGRSFDEAIRQAGFDGSGISEPEAIQLLNSAEYLLCDGLDECDPDRSKIAEQIFRWGVGHNDCRICVATRPVGHEAALLPDFTHFALQAPDDHQVRELSEKLFKKVADNGDYITKYSDFLWYINTENENHYLRKIYSQNPLLLGFLVRLSLDGIDIGKTRSELYSSIFEILARTIPNDRNATELNLRIASEVANALAWKQLHTPFCSSTETMEFVSSHLREKFNLGTLEADEKAESGMKFWEDRRLLETITAGTNSKTFFLHLTLQEFAAARYARELEPQEFSNWIREVRQNPSWKQVILLLAGIDDARTISALLNLDEPDNPVSCEALLVTEALFERDPPNFIVLPQLLESLAARLQSKIPLISIEAALQLARLVPYAKQQISTISSNVESNVSWIYLGKLLLCLLTDDLNETVEEFKEWFKNYSPIFVHFPKMSSRDDSQQFPEEGRKIQNQIIECGLERMIASHELKDIAEYFEEIGECGNISGDVMSKMQQRLVDIGLPETAKILWSSSFDDSQYFGIDSALKKWRKGAINLLRLIVLASGATSVAKDTPPFLSLSILISGLQYWESAAGTLATLEDIILEEDDVGIEIIRALSRALQLDINLLGSEAKAALNYYTKQEHDFTLSKVAESAIAEPDWSILTSDEFDPNLIAQGILHPCSLISLCAAYAVSSGLGKSEAIKLIPEALMSDQKDTIWYAAAVAETCLGNDAVDICLDRLEQPIYADHKCLFGVMARNAQENQRQAVIESFFSWLTVDNSELATGIAEYLSEITPPLDSTNVSKLREILAYWTERGVKCKKDGIMVKGSSCPKCRTVPPSPRSAIVKELFRLGDIQFDELVELCNDPRHDVSELAKKLLVEQAGNDIDILSYVLDQVEEGKLSPRILAEFLKLPIEKEGVVAQKTERLLHSSDLGIRLATIGQLTGEWIDRESAIEYLKTSLEDPEPTIRTLATRILRLLC